MKVRTETRSPRERCMTDIDGLFVHATSRRDRNISPHTQLDAINSLSVSEKGIGVRCCASRCTDGIERPGAPAAGCLPSRWDTLLCQCHPGRGCMRRAHQGSLCSPGGSFGPAPPWCLPWCLSRVARLAAPTGKLAFLNSMVTMAAAVIRWTRWCKRQICTVSEWKDNKGELLCNAFSDSAVTKSLNFF